MHERFSSRTCDVKSRKEQSALAYEENVFLRLQKLSTEAYTLTSSLLLHEARCKSMKWKKMIPCTFEEIVFEINFSRFVSFVQREMHKVEWKGLSPFVTYYKVCFQNWKLFLFQVITSYVLSFSNSERCKSRCMFRKELSDKRDFQFSNFLFSNFGSLLITV